MSDNLVKEPPSLFMLVGLPCTGKSTIIRKELAQRPQTVVLSTDDFIEVYAETHGVSYNEAFASVYGAATANLMEVLRLAIQHDRNVVWDQTNLTAKQRRKKMNHFPSHYRKYAIVVTERDPDVLTARMKEHRPNKVIPYSVLQKMSNDFEMPTKEEDFDEIFLADGTKIE